MGTSRKKNERSFHRNGSLREETSYAGNRRHGPRRAWHPNGLPAVEEFYEHGQLHGLCRQWNPQGRLLGSYRMEHGTGIMREWFPDGRLQSEMSLVAGKFTGRIRVWLRDGTLVNEQFVIENRNVTPAAYAAAAKKQADWPRYRAGSAKKKFPTAEEIDRREFELNIEWLLAQKNKREARAWLKAGTQKCSLGLFQFTQAQSLVEKIYAAGALQVFAVNIYSGKDGKQFSDALLVKLPPEKSARQAIRRLSTKLPAKLRAGVLPVDDCGEEFLFASFA